MWVSSLAFSSHPPRIGPCMDDVEEGKKGFDLLAWPVWLLEDA